MTDTIRIKPSRDDSHGNRSQDKPLNREEKLEEGLEASMDASDPPATTAPGDHGDPVPSSGFSEKDGKDGESRP